MDSTCWLLRNRACYMYTCRYCVLGFYLVWNSSIMPSQVRASAAVWETIGYRSGSSHNGNMLLCGQMVRSDYSGLGGGSTFWPPVDVELLVWSGRSLAMQPLTAIRTMHQCHSCFCVYRTSSGCWNLSVASNRVLLIKRICFTVSIPMPVLGTEHTQTSFTQYPLLKGIAAWSHESGGSWAWPTSLSTRYSHCLHVNIHSNTDMSKCCSSENWFFPLAKVVWTITFKFSQRIFIFKTAMYKIPH